MKSIKQLSKNILFIQKYKVFLKNLQMLLYLFFMNLLWLPYYKFMFLIFGIEYVCRLLLKIYSNKKAFFLLSKFGAKIDANVQIYPPIIIDNTWVTGDFSNLSIEKNVYIGRGVFFDLTDRIIIKENTAISGKVAILTHEDTGPNNLLSSYYPRKTERVEIGSNSWIGFGATILSGVIVGDFVVAGAGAVITKSIPKYSVACGAPAKIVKKLENKERNRN